ncbi:exopolysaccharide transport family protein [Allorhizobium sp. BGMRC 0089]|uniref:exopolysaccharide transport family protein n=1 Tax=Allorhizobium sonneratiae TaxID=2934936 RepID=UPI002033F16E|nr:exopolysaccharide transport family protein [Allorhizobium sonneratiae]MCM2292142.1 exopolysaccharide transport family protein [Allorhizobium sonneratiae]
MSRQPYASHQDADIDIAELFRAIWAAKGRIAFATLLVTGLAFAAANVIKPTYRAEATVLIEPRAPNYDAENAKSADSQPVLDELNIASQVQLFRSADLIRQVAKDLKLYDLKEFDPDKDPSALNTLMVFLHLKRDPLEISPEDRVVKTFLDKLEVYQVASSRVIGIQFSSKDPKLAAAIPNDMVKVYLAIQSGAKLDSNEEAARWLEPEIATLSQKVMAAEQKVADYRKKTDLLPTGDGAVLATRQLNDMATALATARTERIAAEAKAQNAEAAIRSGRPTDDLDIVMGSPAIQQLKNSEAAVQAQISDLSVTLLDGHPRIRALKAQLASLRSQIASESRKAVASLENDAAVARMRERDLDAQLKRLKAQSAEAGEQEVGLNALQRDAAAQRQLLETYLARYREASSRLSSNATPADARVISRAVEPGQPFFPKILPITIVAAVATLVLSMIIVMLSALFSGRALKPAGPLEPETDPHKPTDRFEVKGDDDVGAAEMGAGPSTLSVYERRRQQAAEMAELEPQLDSKAALTTDHEPDHDHAILENVDTRSEASTERQVEEDEPDLDADQSFSVASIARYLRRNRIRRALCLSPQGHDGSAMAVELVRQRVKDGGSAILVDMTGSAIPTGLMAVQPNLPGVTDLLTGDAAFGEAIHADRGSLAHIMPQGRADIRTAMHGLDRLAMVIDALVEAYDLVLIECGPTSPDNVVSLCRNGDEEIILAAPKPVRRTLEQIMEAFKVLGHDDLVLMTQAPISEDGAGHRDVA